MTLPYNDVVLSLSTGCFNVGFSWHSPFFDYGAIVSRSIDAKFLIPSESTVSWHIGTWTALKGPSLGVISFIYDLVVSRSVAEAIRGHWSTWTCCPAGKDSGALWTSRSLLPLFLRCKDFIPLSISSLFAVTRCRSLALKATGDVVALVICSRAVTLSKFVGQGGPW